MVKRGCHIITLLNWRKKKPLICGKKRKYLLEQMFMKKKQKKQSIKIRQKYSMVLYNICYINKTLTDQYLNVYFFDSERVISLYGNRTAVWSNHIWRIYFPLWKITLHYKRNYKISLQKMGEAFIFVSNINFNFKNFFLYHFNNIFQVPVHTTFIWSLI